MTKFCAAAHQRRDGGTAGNALARGYAPAWSVGLFLFRLGRPPTHSSLALTRCEKGDACVTRILWKKIDDAINEVVDHITLEDLLEWQGASADDYVI